MTLGDMLKQTGALEAIARELGIDRQSAQAGAAALLPALIGGLRKQAQMEAGGPAAGGGGLPGLLGSLGGSGLLEAVTARQPTPREPGNRILAQVFGSKAVSRTVAGQAAQHSGIDPAVLKKMLPLLAMAVSGYLASRSGAGAGGVPDGQVPGGQMPGGQMLGANPPLDQARGQQGAAGQRSGGLMDLLDLDGDGNPLDDILRMAGKLRR